MDGSVSPFIVCMPRMFVSLIVAHQEVSPGYCTVFICCCSSWEGLLLLWYCVRVMFAMPLFLCHTHLIFIVTFF